MAKMYKKCNLCRYQYRPLLAFPCRDCNPDKPDCPVTCDMCRNHGEEGAPCARNRKNLKPCKHFMWD